MRRRSLEPYLARHAEPEAALAERLGSYDHALVVPAHDEDAGLIDGVLPAARERVLCIVVANASVGHDDGARSRTVKLCDDLALRIGARPLAEGALLGALGGYDVLLVDRARRPLPRRQGVGLARKIGCDIALAMKERGKLSSGFIHMTDADVTLARDYFVSSTERAAALAYPFVHVPRGNREIDVAHAAYEVHLRYYVLGLAAARSPYAHHTLGSTLAMNAHDYAAVRGVPKREAAEDFYLVNKLCKLGRVVVPEVEPIRIHARRSARVPFGTGRAVAAIEAGRPQHTYHPECFALLASWLQALDRFSSGREDDPIAGMDPLLARALAELDARTALLQLRSRAPAAQLAARVREWFDAFRTLKLVHTLRDLGLASLPWREALARAPFAQTGLDSDDPFEQARALGEIEARNRAKS